MNAFSAADVALLQAAASLAVHAPESMRAAQMVPRLHALARQVAAQIPAEQSDIAPSTSVSGDRKAA